MTLNQMQEAYDNSDDGSDFLEALTDSGVDPDEAERWLEFFMNAEDD